MNTAEAIMNRHARYVLVSVRVNSAVRDRIKTMLSVRE